MSSKPLVFCVATSARSRMAEAIARRLAPENVTISSAGSRPSTVNLYAIRALDEIGIDIRGQPGSNVGSDGAWPHEAIRDVIEHVESERLDSGIAIGKYNARGAHWRAPGGSQEFALAAQYASYAAKCADRWPRTAALLRDLERKYKGEARWHEAREEIDD
jgi:hypothetical protein